MSIRIACSIAQLTAVIIPYGGQMVTDMPDPQTEILASLQHIESLLGVLVKLELGPLMQAELKDPALRALYEMTGERTAREITDATGLALGTVSKTWSRWEQLGLVIKDGQRYKKPF